MVRAAMHLDRPDQPTAAFRSNVPQRHAIDTDKAAGNRNVADRIDEDFRHECCPDVLLPLTARRDYRLRRLQLNGIKSVGSILKISSSGLIFGICANWCRKRANSSKRAICAIDIGCA
jgi:hypothetical protein